MTDFLTADTNLPSYMMFPRFLLDMEINETAKMLYICLLYTSTKGEFLLNRCDFSSISTCLKNHISESNQMSQPDFLYELFEDFMDDP